MTDVVIIGAGGFGREALDVAEATIHQGRDLRIAGVLDDALSTTGADLLQRRGVAFLGGLTSWLNQPDDVEFVVAVGDPATRERLADRLEAAGLRAATLVHPSAVVGTRVVLGPGTVVCGGVQLSTEVTTGRHVHVSAGALIGHDVTTADFVSINPGAIISGGVQLGRGTLVGAGAVVLQNLQVGAGSTVGAAACVVRSVPPGQVVKGVPAR